MRPFNDKQIFKIAYAFPSLSIYFYRSGSLSHSICFSHSIYLTPSTLAQIHVQVDLLKPYGMSISNWCYFRHTIRCVCVSLLFFFLHHTWLISMPVLDNVNEAFEYKMWNHIYSNIQWNKKFIHGWNIYCVCIYYYYINKTGAYS